MYIFRICFQSTQCIFFLLWVFIYSPALWTLVYAAFYHIIDSGIGVVTVSSAFTRNEYIFCYLISMASNHIFTGTSVGRNHFVFNG